MFVKRLLDFAIKVLLFFGVGNFCFRNVVSTALQQRIVRVSPVIMKLLLLTLLCLVSLASCRLADKRFAPVLPFSWTVAFTDTTTTTTTLPPELSKPSPDDFLVLASVKDESDLDPDQVAQLEKDGEPVKYLRQVQNSSSSARKSLLVSSKEGGLSPAYSSAVKVSSVQLFDEKSSKNEEVVSAKVSIPIDRPGLYHCPHKTYLLRWFPLYYRGKVYEFCFIPWATNQAITYARCSTSSCPTQYYYTYPSYRRRYGRCNVSCYERVNITAFCYNVQKCYPYWKTITRSLPQACKCSTVYRK